ncbi:MAG: YihY/virulence factor BrkB family protein [Gaiella sp.]|nr:YihY/virulence factor BrkB family protein [Gaiella sp.]
MGSEQGKAREAAELRAPSRRARVEARATLLAERAQAERARHPSVDAVFEMVDRDGEAGGGIIAGALAYRFFIWLLPLALVSVAGLGLAADAASESPDQTARKLGLSGLVSSSVANAAQGPGRWYALAIGIPILVYVTRSLLRALIVTHRLLWQDTRAAAPKPTLKATLGLLVLLLGFSAAGTLASAMRAWSPGPGVLVTLLAVVPAAGLWLAITLYLPHRSAHWTGLVPGALLGALGLEALHVFTAYVLAPYAIAKQGTYGVLGAAAALLLGLFVLSRLVVAAAVLNAILWERREGGGGRPAPSGV